MFDFIHTDAQRALRNEARIFTKWVPKQMILDMDTEKIQFPHAYLQEAGRRNLLGIRIPKRYGGRGLGWVEDTIVAEEIGVASYSLACLWGVGADIVAEAIREFGGEKLKQEIVVPLLQGKLYAAEGLTEPRSGSDFFGATTKAVRDGNGFRITGQKRFIVGGEGADYFLIYAKTDDKAPGHKSITTFLVPRDAGVKSEYLYGLMGVRGGGAARLSLKDVYVPEEYVLNEVNGGFAVFMKMMIPERLGTAAMTIGSVRPALEIATRYSSRRKAFGITINNFQAVSFKIADSVMLLDAARSLVYTTALAIDSGKANPRRIRRMVSGIQDVRHRGLPGGGQQRHAGHGRHRLYERLPHRTHPPRYLSVHDLGRDQRDHAVHHPARMVQGIRAGDLENRPTRLRTRCIPGRCQRREGFRIRDKLVPSPRRPLLNDQGMTEARNLFLPFSANA